MLSTILKASLLAAALGAVPAPAYEARVTGATTATLRGEAEFGTPGAASPLVILLGAYSEDGAILLNLPTATVPAPGTYRIAERPTAEGAGALVVTGSPTRPTGAFQAQHGTLTITGSSPDSIEGRFEMYARGFVAAQPDREDRELVVSGSFSAARRLRAVQTR